MSKGRPPPTNIKPIQVVNITIIVIISATSNPSEDGRHHHRHHLIGTPQCHFGVKVLKEAENGFIVGPEPASIQCSCSSTHSVHYFCSSTPSVHYSYSSTPSVLPLQYIAQCSCMQFYSRKSPPAWCEYNGT